jgi:hypothetical protein
MRRRLQAGCTAGAFRGANYDARDLEQVIDLYAGPPRSD